MPVAKPEYTGDVSRNERSNTPFRKSVEDRRRGQQTRADDGVVRAKTIVFGVSRHDLDLAGYPEGVNEAASQAAGFAVMIDAMDREIFSAA